MAITCSIQFFTGIVKFLNLYIRLDFFNVFAGSLSEIHDWNGIILTITVSGHFILHWKWFHAKSKSLIKIAKLNRRTINYILDIGMLVSFFLLFITGIIKIPSLLITRGILYANSIMLLIIHDWSGILLGILALTHAIRHRSWIISTTKKMFMKSNLTFILIGTVSTVLVLSLTVPVALNLFQLNYSQEVSEEESFYLKTQFQPLKLNPENVQTVRPDLFQDGHYSVFDILVNLDNAGKIDMEYHFDDYMDTYVIDSINGTTNWWYYAYYHGGWPENNVFRMDHYPYKPPMIIYLYHIDAQLLQKIYYTFREECARLRMNKGKVIIPNVIIKSDNFRYEFEDVEVTAHNLRNDTLQNDVITAIDVILSLGEKGLISYEIKWMETIGDAIVKSYYVEGINGRFTEARCGFVYESGDWDFEDAKGNHIHIPSDMRIITSPEYEKWFYACV